MTSKKTPNGTTDSVFDKKGLQNIYREIREVYLSDSRPWVIGYSGGKDSTTALQLVWYAIAELPEEKRTKPVFVISSDTLVETPVIVDYLTTTLERINKTAAEKKMPFKAFKLTPRIIDSFWVNLIGKGYPAPSTQFRWCTERLKIRTADRFILESVTKYGEVVMILGVRKGESATRDQVMNLYKIEGSKLSHHSRFPQSYVYTPIEEFSVDDVWTYLLQKPSPWGNNNRDLLALYKSAQDGECPLVVDTETASCGNSRFGCWVCTVVQKDRSMEALIESGEDWMEPLLDFRNELAETQIPEKKLEYRDYRRMNGKVKFMQAGDSKKVIPGPYTLEYSKILLRKLLEAQKSVRKNGPNPNFSLILLEELQEIRRIWMTQKSDWNDSVVKIYEEVTGERLDWTKDDLGSFSQSEQDLLKKICDDQKLPLRLVTKLLDVERQMQGMTRRSSIYNRIGEVLSEDWISEDEVKKALINPKAVDTKRRSLRYV
ncbi:phosphoadenosine phosphosulfate reductase [Methanoregula boonei 6A8]|jgi:DNA sulfur modification protein DndC|uniref:Phosphoadenosine phosphosulfate reductase n=1 Tax=Methanoregula boonei (strain DSM 21154 / JCM 14090 / 6A8) TaxID=456442 RepID=A7I568_METB6|nr:DNA phosphorothioation system sulfurtransferase DndC [Methanoregula boonei]ABS54879.1 phosphoadenosine phosphosulfate reductase [Methanoregula boonei 6A8]